MFIAVILVVVFISIVVRLIAFPFRYGYRRFGYYDNPYRYGCRRHHRLLGSIFPILVLVALDRIFNRRF